MKGLILVGVALVVAGPFITIWSLNTLFGLDIAYTVWTWLAVMWLVAITFGRYSSSK